AGQRAEGIHVGALAHQAPELLRAAAGERVLDLEAPAQAVDVLGGVTAFHSVPARVLGPILLDALHFQFTRGHAISCGHMDFDRSTRWNHCSAANRNWYFDKRAFADCEGLAGAAPSSS